MFVLALTGCSHSGKSTVASILVQKHGFEEYTLAAPLKNACSIVFDLDPINFEQQELKEIMDIRWKMTPRTMMQTLGTECIRNKIAADHWINLLRLKLEKLPQDARVVISDIRFDNEAEFVRNKLNAILIRIDRHSALCSLDTRRHSSEAGIAYKKPDIVITNNGHNMADLKEEVARVLQQFDKSDKRCILSLCHH